MCTGLKLTCRDGSVVAGRTAEFGIDLDLRWTDRVRWVRSLE